MKRIGVLNEVLPYALACIILFSLSFFYWRPLSIGFLILFVFSIFFFRDPQRYIPHTRDVILAPADGKVVGIEGIDNHPLLEKPATKIDIVLSLLDVHINRAPVEGVVKKSIYSKGKKFPAKWDRAQSRNEKNHIVIEGKDFTVIVTQIAGIVARRIVQWVDEGNKVSLGEKIGMIKFSSRTEIIFPNNVQVLARRGQKVKAGETILGVLK
ncbi:phosphatidylserine decarboxylase [Candidatus Altiarchaeota archaeon]